MMIYLVAFIVSLTILGFSENRFQTGSRWKKSILLFAIAVPSFIAGVRDVGVGIDTVAYGKLAFDWAFRFNFVEYVQRFGSSKLFYSMFYVLAKTFKNIAFPFFAIEFFIEYLLLNALLTLKGGNHRFRVWIGMACYYFVFYGYSLNLMRQSMAVAVVIWAYAKYLKERKHGRYVCWITVAALFHSTAIVGFITLALDFAFRKNVERKQLNKYISYFSITVATILSFLAFGSIANLLVTLNIVSQDLIFNGTVSVRGTFNTWIFFAVLCVLVIVICYFIKYRGPTVEFEQFLLFMALIIFWLNILKNNAYRISFYYLYLLVLVYPQIMSGDITSTVRLNNRRILQIVSILAFFVFWMIIIVSWHSNGVVPYSSAILKIGG